VLHPFFSAQWSGANASLGRYGVADDPGDLADVIVAVAGFLMPDAIALRWVIECWSLSEQRRALSATARQPAAQSSPAGVTRRSQLGGDAALILSWKTS
jgi:hypothetical protein